LLAWTSRKGSFLPGVDSSKLAAADAHDDAGRLSQELAILLFTKEELASGCATKPHKPGFHQLDTKRLHAIRGGHNILNSFSHAWLKFNLH